MTSPVAVMHGLHTGDLTGMVAAVSSNQFVSTVWVRPGNRRNQYAVLPDAFGGVCHRFIILDFERVVLKGMELRQRDFHDFFPVFIGILPSLGFPGEAASMPLANPWHQLTEIPGKLLIFHLVSDIMYD